VERKKSEREIRQKLYEKGIEIWLVDRVISDRINAATMKTMAEELILKKWHSLHMYPLQKRKEKVLQFIMRKGFTYDDVAEIIQTLIATEKGQNYE
jgi:SOS response regulatory protein OraA/RecX